jgi:hypothetical protein
MKIDEITRYWHIRHSLNNQLFVKAHWILRRIVLLVGIGSRMVTAKALETRGTNKNDRIRLFNSGRVWGTSTDVEDEPVFRSNSEECPSCPRLSRPGSRKVNWNKVVGYTGLAGITTTRTREGGKSRSSSDHWKCTLEWVGWEIGNQRKQKAQFTISL